ncbi:hypothetical protein Tco_1122175, partial [Tanacetum coccineum]
KKQDVNGNSSLKPILKRSSDADNVKSAGVESEFEVSLANLGSVEDVLPLACSVSYIVEDFVKRLRSTYTSRNYVSHYKEPTELEIQEMVNILVSGEAYDKVFNHLDMLHASLEGKCSGMTWKFKGNLKLRGSLFHSWKIRFEDVHVLKVKIRLLFVLSSSNRGRLLGFIDLMIQKQ